MLKNILKLEGVTVLKKEEQKGIDGGKFIDIDTDSKCKGVVCPPTTTCIRGYCAFLP